VVAFAEVYVDESGTHATSDMVVVAGYVFRRVNARRFQKDWSRILRSEGLRHFHMTDCANGRGDYKDWTPERRVRIEKKLIALTHKESAFGFAIGVRPSVFRKTIPGEIMPYSFLLSQCLLVCQYWARRANFRNKFAYFFEAGNEGKTQANEVMAVIAAHEKAREAAQYVSHTFVTKDQAAPLQAADMLAWLSRNALEKREAGKYPRKDFLALKREQDLLQYFDEISLGPLRHRDAISKAIAKGYSHLWKESGWGEPNFEVDWPDWPKPDA